MFKAGKHDKIERKNYLVAQQTQGKLLTFGNCLW